MQQLLSNRADIRDVEQAAPSIHRGCMTNALGKMGMEMSGKGLCIAWQAITDSDWRTASGCRRMVYGTSCEKHVC